MKRLKYLLPILLIVLVSGSFFVAKPVHAAPADAYWVGGSGNWNDPTNHWATSSGGAPNVANMPDGTSNVHIDNNSDSGATTITFNANSSVLNIDFSAMDAVITFAGANILTVNGSFTLSSLLTWTYTGTINFSATATGKTITTAGIALNSPITFNGIGGGWTLQDNFTNGVGRTVTLSNGALDTNSKTVSIGGLTGSGASARSLTLGTTTMSITGWDFTTTTNLTFSAVSSTINMTGGGYTFALGGLTYGTVTLYTNNSNADIITGANAFTNLRVIGSNTFVDGVRFGADQVITGTLTWTGYNGSHRLRVQSNTSGTSRQITAAAVAITNSDISDMVGVGAASWNISAGLNSDYGGNLGIIFTTPQNNYWVGNAANWSDLTHWASTSGGTGGTGRVPLIQDTAVLDTNSFSVPTRTLTVDMTNLGNLNATAVTNTPIFSKAGEIDFYGSVNIGTLTYSVTTTKFMGGFPLTLTSLSTLTTNLYCNTNPTLMTSFYAGNGFTVAGTIYLAAGTLNLNNFNVTASYFDSSTTTYNRALLMGSGVFTLNGTGNVSKWNVDATNLSLYSQTSILLLSNSGANGQTFAGAGLTYYNVTVTGAGNYTMTFTGNNVANYLTIDRSLAAKTISGNVTWTVNQLFIPKNGVIVVTIANTDFTKTSGTVVTDYLNFNSGANTCTAGGGATFYAGVHSITAPQTGWNFSDPAPPTISSVAATQLGVTSAALNGNLSNLGGYGTVFVYYQYGTDPALASYSSSAPMTSYLAPSTDAKVVTGLATETVYYFKAIASDGVSDLATGAILSFTTGGSPTVSTLSAVAITQYAATLQGQITSMGNYATVEVYFEWGTTAGYGTTTAHQTKIVAGSFNQPLSGLSPNTIYHFRADLTYGSNITLNALDGTFTTLSTTGGVPTPPLGYTVPSQNQIPNWWAGGSNIPNLPLYGMFLNTSNSTGIPVQTLYMFIVLGFGILLAVTTIMQTHTIFLGMLVLFVIMAMGSAATVVPGWMILTYILLSVGIVFVWRQQ